MSDQATLSGSTSKTMTSRGTITNNKISHWLLSEMECAGRESLPIHIDSDLEDDDDPFEEQPKQFLLTAERKRILERELKERRWVYTIRKYRRQELEKRRRVMRAREGRRARKGRFSLAKLPNELILEVIRHTRVNDLQNLLLSAKPVYDVFEANKAAVAPGIETTQFSELKWLFGNGRQRSARQKQALKDYMGTYQIFDSPYLILEWFEMIDKGEFTKLSTVGHFQEVENRLTECVRDFESIPIAIARRSALCLHMFSSCRMEFDVQDSDQDVSGKDGKAVRSISSAPIPVEERIQLFQMQPPEIKTNLRDVLEKITKQVNGDCHYCSLLGEHTREWMVNYYSQERVGHKMEPHDMGVWIAKLAAGYTFEVLLPALPWIGSETVQLCEDTQEHYSQYRDALFNEYWMQGSTDGLWKESRDFADAIGLNVGRMLEGTAVGWYLERMLYDTGEEVVW